MIDRNKQIGGDHYTRLAIQPWDVIQATRPVEEYRGYLYGNVIKYLMRDKVDRVEDLQKAAHYLEELLSTFPEPPGVSGRAVSDQAPGAPGGATWK